MYAVGDLFGLQLICLLVLLLLYAERFGDIEHWPDSGWLVHNLCHDDRHCLEAAFAICA
jgi:hypothetical protein